jgi:hypothetical protein
MKATETKRIGTTFTTPAQQVVDVSGSSVTSFSIEVSGEGSFTGLNYTIPANTDGKVSSKIEMPCLTSEDVKNLNSAAMGMLNASYKQKVIEHEKTSASADLSVWSWLFGGAAASASYEKTRDTMKSKGLTDEQVNKLMDAFLKMATTMSKVELDLNIDNRKNDYSVSGDLSLYTISGTVKTDKGTHQYRMLANKGNVGGAAGKAPASVKIALQ